MKIHWKRHLLETLFFHLIVGILVLGELAKASEFQSRGIFQFRGHALSAEMVRDLAVEDLKQMRQDQGMMAAPIPLCAVKMHKIQYLTPNLQNKLVKASGMILIPRCLGSQKFPVMSYQHGTNTDRTYVPSNPNFAETKAMAILYASGGYIVVMADYLGLGDSEGLHPYLHVASQASATEDMLTAAGNFLKNEKIRTTGELFLAGYSQGGHVTLSLHRALEDHGHRFFGGAKDVNLPTGPFDFFNRVHRSLAEPTVVTASAPMAGPYDLADSTLRGALVTPSRSSATYAAYLIMAMNEVYHLFGSLQEVIQEPYASQMATLFDGSHGLLEISQHLPATPKDLLRPEFLADVLSNENNSLHRALQKNNLYEWVPKAPVRFFYGSKDHDVPFQNSEIAYGYMKAKGATVDLVNVGPFDHPTAALPSLVGGRLWFDHVRVTHPAEVEQTEVFNTSPFPRWNFN